MEPETPNIFITCERIVVSQLRDGLPARPQAWCVVVGLTQFEATSCSCFELSQVIFRLNCVVLDYISICT